VIQKQVTYPRVAVVYDGFTGQLRSKVVPGIRETASFWLQPGENFLTLIGQPYDDATCNDAILAVVGHIWK
jgi:hypothetical protein